MPAIAQGLTSLRTYIADAQQQQTEAAMTGGHGLDELKPHGPVQPLPTGLRARDAVNRVRNALPTPAQACQAAKVAGKFAAYAVPLSVAGTSVGIANHYLTRAVGCLFFDDAGGDPHAMAWAGLATGLVEAGLLATNRYAEASGLAVGVLAGTAANFGGTFLGSAVGAIAGGVASLPHLAAWMVNASWHTDAFTPVFRVVTPMAQALLALAAGGGAGYGLYDDLRQQREAEGSVV